MSAPLNTRRAIGTKCLRMLATSIAVSCAAMMPSPLWAQASWQYGTNTISTPAGVNVGIGTSTPGSTLTLYANGSQAGISVYTDGLSQSYTPATLFSYSGSSQNYGGLFQGLGARGTSASPSAAQSGDWLAGLRGYGYGTTNVMSAALLMIAGSAFTSSSAETYMTFRTTPSGSTLPVDRMRIAGNGNIGIGTASPQYPLSVNGTIQAKEVLVNAGWSDYVFNQDYHLRQLNEVAAYIKEHHHLPEIPSESEIQEKGVSLGEMQAKLLAKVEELTLLMIQADERSTRLERQNRESRQQNRELRARIARLEGSAR